MLADLSLPDGLELVRTTPAFTASTVPAGLQSAHRVAEGVWGLLRVKAGALTFVHEATGERRRLVEGETQVIEPAVLHHVEPEADAVFVVEFHR